MEILIVLVCMLGYLVMWAWTTKKLYAAEYGKWMDREISKARRRARNAGEPFDPEETLYRLRAEWNRESKRHQPNTDHEKLIPLVVFLGIVWWIAWPLKWMSNDFGADMPETHETTLLRNEALEAEIERLRSQQGQ